MTEFRRRSLAAREPADCGDKSLDNGSNRREDLAPLRSARLPEMGARGARHGSHRSSASVVLGRGRR